MDTISIPQAHQLVYELEDKHGLLNYKVDGWSVWPILRWDFINQLTGQVVVQERAAWSVSMLAKILFEDIKGLAKLKKAEHLILTKDLNLRERDGQYYKDVFFDDLLARMENFLKIESLHSATFFEARKRAQFKSQFTLTTLKKIASVLPARFSPADIPHTAERLSGILLPYTKSKRFTAAHLKKEFSDFYLAKQLFKWLLGRIKPRYVWLINAHGYPSFVAAAKEKGIKVIELQHGVLYQYHPGYSWNQNALPYKTSMPIPDYLLLYGEFWKEALEKNGFWSDELRVVGSPRLDRFRTSSGKQSSKVQMVVSTQPLVSPAIYCDYFQKFMQLAKGQFDFEITFKLHQREINKEAYLQSFPDTGQVKVLLNNEQPSTFDLLREATLHLSIASTCHYEALALGTPTVVLPLINHEAMLPLIERGYGIVCETPEKLVDLINSNKLQPVDDQIRDTFFRRNAVDNILTFLASIKP